MTSAPTVSVITISFNDLDGLQRTVKSVRAQRYRGRIEHIVIDGGSGDDVVAYLSGCEPGFAYWQSEPDGGRYDAMNQGIAHASGDLLWFLHSADRFSGPDVVAQAVEALSGKGPVSELWGFGMDRLVGLDRVRGADTFQPAQIPGRQAGCSASSIVLRIVAGGQDRWLRP
ncbi:glycosyl transferase family protein [Mycobacterium tuberculosis]|nr:glycosyl transferase family protein [Mycobacterium tuberculosis]CKZ38600.1 glycosyl transferase family protein [Mycobacterium tuberculosis]